MAYEILRIRETSNSRRQIYQMEKFRAALTDCNLSDLGYCGTPFTFSNKRKGLDEFKARLDRFVATPEWKNAFPNTHVSHLSAISSDHIRIYF